MSILFGILDITYIGDYWRSATIFAANCCAINTNFI